MFFSCGAVTWVLAGLLAVSVILYFERLVDFRRTQVDYQDFLKGVFNVLDAGNVEEALSICEDVSAPVARVASAAIRHRTDSAQTLRDAVDSQGRVEIGRLDRRLAALAIIAQIAPLLGLFGTILGFVRTVRLSNAQAVVSRIDLLNGSMEALVCAAAGLAVAIVAVIFYGSLRVRLDRAVVELEAAANAVVGHLLEGKEGRR